jgi:hypothetical protein
MNLRDFVKQAIVEIIEGVADANSEIGQDCVDPSPHMTTQPQELAKQGYFNGQNHRLVQSVDFDVAVTATEGTETKGGIGIFVAGFGVGTQGSSNQASSSLSRIRFKIPISFKSQNNTD